MHLRNKPFLPNLINIKQNLAKAILGSIQFKGEIVARLKLYIFSFSIFELLYFFKMILGRAFYKLMDEFFRILL